MATLPERTHQKLMFARGECPSARESAFNGLFLKAVKNFRRSLENVGELQ
jgi:hypothetical protein